MKKLDVIEILMDFQNQLLIGLARPGLVDRDKLYRAVAAAVAAVSDFPEDKIDV